MPSFVVKFPSCFRNNFYLNFLENCENIMSLFTNINFTFCDLSLNAKLPVNPFFEKSKELRRVKEIENNSGCLHEIHTSVLCIKHVLEYQKDFQYSLPKL